MFANPYMLVGLAVAVLPIVVHLLSRARYRSVEWGAMMFLEGADAAQASGRRFNQWLLLLIRAAMVALLALALARPEWHGRDAVAGAAPASNAPRRQLAVILLDCSGSMGFEENGQPRMATARDAAKQVLGLHRGDRVSVVLMGQDQPEADRLPTADLWEAGKQVESAEVGTGRADIPLALEEAADMVAGFASRDASAERAVATFYVVADRQAENWRRILDTPTGEWAAGWRKRLAAAGVAGRVVVIPIGSAEAGNIAVTGIRLVDSPVIAGHPVEFDVMVQNRGPVQWAQVPLVVTLDRRTTIFEQRINLAPEQSATFRVQSRAGFSTAGTHLVSAEVNPPIAGATVGAAPRAAGLTTDDRFELVVDVRDPVRVLVLSGDEPPPPPQNDRNTARGDRPLRAPDYITAALSPFRSARRDNAPAAGVDPCLVELAYAEHWSGSVVRLSAHPADRTRRDNARDATLSQFEVIVLANIEQLTDAQAVALERFVDDGGGLLVAPGEVTRVDELNWLLFADGAGLLPASLEDPTPPDWVDLTTLLGYEPHPALRFLAGKPDAFLPAVVGRWCPVDRLGGQARVLMRYASGEPFLIESMPSASLRRGKVMLLTTSLDADWSTLPMTGFYVPFLQSTVRYLAEGQTRDLNVGPGELLEVPLPETGGQGRLVRVRPPESPDERSGEIARVGGRVFARYADTATPGVYTMRILDPGRRMQTVQFAVNASREESNLVSLTPEQWARVEREVDARLVDPAVTPIATAAALPAPLEVWPFALGAVFLLGLAEMKLARNWSRTDATDE